MSGTQVTKDSLDTKLLLTTLMAIKKGDFSVRLPIEWTGINGKIADTFNEIIALNEKMAKELGRLSHVVGREGKISENASLDGTEGSWAGIVKSVNALIDDLARPTKEMVRVIGSVAKGDLSQAMPLEVGGQPLQGDFLVGARTVNTGDCW
jgi:nitrogen fixation/metabolism regulation signal transduction histidine kinase